MAGANTAAARIEVQVDRIMLAKMLSFLSGKVGDKSTFFILHHLGGFLAAVVLGGRSHDDMRLHSRKNMVLAASTMRLYLYEILTSPSLHLVGKI